jgi:hypothetical protein
MAGPREDLSSFLPEGATMLEPSEVEELSEEAGEPLEAGERLGVGDEA